MNNKSFFLPTGRSLCNKAQELNLKEGRKMATYEACQTVDYSTTRIRCSADVGDLGECYEYKVLTDKEECMDSDTPVVALSKLNQLMNGYCGRSKLKDCRLGKTSVRQTFWSQVAEAFALASRYCDYGPKW